MGLGFTTPKMVVIQDVRLAILQYTLLAGILGYLVFNLIIYKLYFYIEQPVGTVNAWAESGTPIIDAVKGDFPYCDNSIYDYDIGGYWIFNPIGCRALSWLDMFEKTADGVFITTMFKEQVQTSRNYFTTAASSSIAVADCAGRPANNPCPDCSTFNSDYVGDYLTGCIETKQSSYFVSGVDNMQVSFEHDFQSSAALMIRGSSATEDQMGVTTFVIFPNGTNKTWEKGNTISLTLSDWLTLANVDLDERNKDAHAYEAIAGANKGKFPFTRVMGTRLTVDLLISNNNATVDSTGHIICQMFVNASKEVWGTHGPFISWIEHPSIGDPKDWKGLSTYRMGIHFKFRTVGLLRKFSYQQVINTLVSGMAMLSVAALITNFVAQYCIPKASVFYRSFIKEKVDFEKEVAHFGAMRANAGLQWSKMGSMDDDGSIDMSELCTMLKLSNPPLEQHQAEALAYMIMNEADCSAGNSGLSDGKLAFSEWFTVLVGDRTSMADVINDILDDEGLIEGLKKTADKKKAKYAKAAAEGKLDQMNEDFTETLVRKVKTCFGGGKKKAKKGTSKETNNKVEVMVAADAPLQEAAKAPPEQESEPKPVQVAEVELVEEEEPRSTPRSKSSRKHSKRDTPQAEEEATEEDGLTSARETEEERDARRRAERRARKKKKEARERSRSRRNAEEDE